MDKNLADLRRDYSLQELSESLVSPDPFVQFANWFDEYLNSAPLEPSAFTLATVRDDGSPASRVVLLKGFDSRGFVFFTNYESRKGRHLEGNPASALHFFWPELERQVNVEGRAERTSREESEAYFATRPRASQIGAWASKQSELLSCREDLEAQVEEIRTRFDGQDVPCPPFWGGYRVVPARFEFWQGRPSRLHDRICYDLAGDRWNISRLSP